MLTTPYYFLIHIFGHGFQDCLLHHLPRDQLKADWEIPQILPSLSLLFLKARKNSFLSVFRSLPIAMTFWRLIISNDIRQLPLLHQTEHYSISFRLTETMLSTQMQWFNEDKCRKTEQTNCTLHYKKKRLMSSKKHSVITDVHSDTVKTTGDKLGISTNSQNLNILPKVWLQLKHWTRAAFSYMIIHECDYTDLHVTCTPIPRTLFLIQT